MKILIATPLYPPDVAAPAPFVKTLAEHLAHDHEVSIVHYGDLPEAVEGVTYYSVASTRSLPARLVSFTRTLRAAARRADVVLFENGPSVELPALLATLTTRTPFVLHEGDTRACEHTRTSVPLRALHALARLCATTLVETSPPERPEILPFADYPQEELENYERSWDAFVTSITATLRHVAK